MSKARRQPRGSRSPQLGDEKGDGWSGFLQKLESRRVVEGLETLLVDPDHTISFLESEEVMKVVKMFEDIKTHLKTSIDNACHVPIDSVHVDPAGSSSNLYTKSTLEVKDGFNPIHFFFIHVVMYIYIHPLITQSLKVVD